MNDGQVSCLMIMALIGVFIGIIAIVEEPSCKNQMLLASVFFLLPPLFFLVTKGILG